MYFEKLAGMASAVGIVLIVTIVIAAAGPDFKLKDWQPLMAAVLALIGGALAYRGAMAKVDLDREVAAAEIKSKKLGVFSRIRFDIFLILAEAGANLEAIPLETPVKGTVLISIKELSFGGAELNEAWNSLELFPIEALPALGALRRAVPWTVATFNSFSRDQTWTINEGEDLSADLRLFAERCRDIRDLCMEIDEQLAKAISELRGVSVGSVAAHFGRPTHSQ